MLPDQYYDYNYPCASPPLLWDMRTVSHNWLVVSRARSCGVHPKMGASFWLPLGSYTGTFSPLLWTTPNLGCTHRAGRIQDSFATLFLERGRLADAGNGGGGVGQVLTVSCNGVRRQTVPPRNLQNANRDLLPRLCRRWLSCTDRNRVLNALPLRYMSAGCYGIGVKIGRGTWLAWVDISKI